MQMYRCGWLLLAMVSLNGLAHGETKWYSDLSAARAEAERLNRPILCHFFGEWCLPCQKMERSVLNEPPVLEQLGGTVIGVKVDVDKHPDLVRRFAVSKFPTDIFLEPGGERLLESQGFHPINEYVAMMQRASTRYADLLAKRQPRPSAPVANIPNEGSTSQELASQSNPAPKSAKVGPIMLDGYCAVTLWKHRRWVKGSEQFKGEYKGQEYVFSSAEALHEFTENPERFVPRFLGCDPVVVWDTDRAIAGKTQFGAFYDDELYLFSTAENRKTFKASPDRYIRTRVVLRPELIETAIQ